MSTEAMSETGAFEAAAEPIVQVELVVTTDAGTDVETSLPDLPDWQDDPDETEPTAPTPTIDLSNPKVRRAWWRSMATSTGLATLAWEKAIRGTAFHTLTSTSDQWIVVVVVPSAAWFRPIKDLVGLKSRAHFHEAVPQTRPGWGETAIDQVIRLQKSMFVMTSDLRNVTPAVRVSADLTIVVPAPDVELVRALLLRAGRGAVPRHLDPGLLAGLDFADLCTAIRPGRRVSDTLAALARASADRVAVPAETQAPDLGSTRAFGAAGEWGLQLAQDIADYRAGKISWAEVDRGALIHGLPGTGKSLFARSLAQHCKVPIVIATVSDYFANSAGDLDAVVKAQREVFARASALKPSILFLDEIDAIPNRHSLSNRGRDWWTPVINDFLTLLDSATSDRAGVVVIGATNIVAAIDPAILRPGRLERSIELPPPDAEGLLDTLRHHLGNELADIDLLPFARRRQGATGAEVMEWVRAARRIARLAHRPLELADLEAVTSAGSTMSEADLRRAAIHEAGHAAVILHLGRAIESITLDPIDGVGGRVRAVHAHKSLLTRQDMVDECLILLAGRAAEEVVLGAPSTGAGGSTRSDLARATELMLSLHQSFGLGSHLVYGGPPTAIDALPTDPWLRPIIAKELAEIYSQVLDIVRTARNAIDAVACRLTARKFLTGKDISDTIARKLGS